MAYLCEMVVRESGMAYLYEMVGGLSKTVQGEWVMLLVGGSIFSSIDCCDWMTMMHQKNTCFICWFSGSQPPWWR